MTILVNGVEVPPGPEGAAELAAAHELLRQRAVATDLLAAGTSEAEAIAAAIETLLAREVAMPEPTEAECRRYYDGHRTEFISGDLVHARHILFQVTPQVNVPLMRARAEEALNTLLAEPERFAELAAQLSNCPSAEQGGNLGQIARGDMVPEFEQAIFKFGASGVLRDLIKTRFGFHIVAVDRSIPGEIVPFEAVQGQIADRLRAQVEEKALRQYISLLAGQADIEGIDLDAATTPLVQ